MAPLLSLRHVYAVSDVHADHAENMAWIRNLDDDAFAKDVLLIAGDVSEKTQVFDQALATLATKFGLCFYVPGNHDLWCRRDGADGPHSMAKLDHLLERCAHHGVLTSPHRVRLRATECAILPLFSWYHETFDVEPDVEGLRLPSVSRAVLDYSACRWSSPSLTTGSEALAHAFDGLNDERIGAPQPRHPAATPLGSWEELQRGEPCISFSHFLPRIELMPEKRFLTYPPLMKCIGSAPLGARVASIAPDIHVFGHTHFGWCSTLDGTCFVQAALGTPRERKSRMRSLAIGDISSSPVRIYDGIGGAPSAPYEAAWSKYYEENEREPSETAPAPWVVDYYRKRAPSRVTMGRPPRVTLDRPP